MVSIHKFPFKHLFVWSSDFVLNFANPCFSYFTTSVGFSK